MLLPSRLEVYEIHACGRGDSYYYGNGYDNYKGSGFFHTDGGSGQPCYRVIHPNYIIVETPRDTAT